MAKHKKLGARLQKRGGKGSKAIRPPSGLDVQAPPRVATQTTVKPQRVLTGPRQSLRLDLFWVLPALLLGLLVYVNTLHGAFVYDDGRQIVRNVLIQDDSQFWHALTSDVWAFQGRRPGC